MPRSDARSPLPVLLMLLAAVLAGCATREPAPATPQRHPDEARAFIARALPPGTGERAGWATDIYAAFASLQIPLTPSNVCAVVGVTEQESGFRADPVVPNLGDIAWRQIEQRAEAVGVPMFLVRAALQVPSPDGRSYSERISRARTERELSETFEALIDLLPMGRRLFSSWNPVATGGAMQVSIAFAEAHAKRRPYPYPVETDIRREVFTRRGGMYFGIAHLLDYPADYDRAIYRFADFNAGHWASRNAALQNAISIASGIPLVRDGDLIRRDAGSDQPGHTESAARVLGARLGIGERALRRDLEAGDGPDLADTTLYRKVFALAEQVAGQALPRAVLPQITLSGPKITRQLTTAWFARRVDTRYQRCLARAGQLPAAGERSD